jgi:uncharacterized membrane-anchored protein YitT (DUF2179 family)
MIRRYLLITIGSVIGAVSVLIFMAPFNIAPGGVSGVSVILNKLLGTPIGVMIFLLNIPIQFIGYRMLPEGWRVVVRTIVVLVIYALALDLLDPFIPDQGVSENVLLNALFGGITGGISTGMVYRAGGTFGGTSTLALIVQRKTGIPMSTTFLYTDTLVIAAAGLFFGWEAMLYAIVALFVGGVATDYVLEGPSVIRTAVIITNRPQEISESVIRHLHRGATAWEATGMYTGQARWVVYVTIARSQVQELRMLVQRTDPDAFLVIGQGHSAYGEGFTASRGK